MTIYSDEYLAKKENLEFELSTGYIALRATDWNQSEFIFMEDESQLLCDEKGELLVKPNHNFESVLDLNYTWEIHSPHKCHCCGLVFSTSIMEYCPDCVGDSQKILKKEEP